jgi:hypothetical protein
MKDNNTTTMPDLTDSLPLGIVVRFPEDNELVMFQDFRWWKGIPSGVDFVIEKKANMSEYWLSADGYGNLEKPNSYGNGKIAVSEKIIKEVLQIQ